MKITTILFDLDGTLLPMDQDVFVKNYFKTLATKLAAVGYEPKQLMESIWIGTAAMVKNDGSLSNESVFWNKFEEIYGDRIFNDKVLFDEFYHNEFQTVKACCGYNPKAAQAVAEIKNLGYRVALATNPIFPAIATESRIRWAGLEIDDFELYTTYENSSYCKPNPEYYRAVAQKLGVNPEECLMVGNDAIEDTAAQVAGMQVFLLTDCLINKNDADISAYPNGDFERLLDFIKNKY